MCVGKCHEYNVTRHIFYMQLCLLILGKMQPEHFGEINPYCIQILGIRQEPDTFMCEPCVEWTVQINASDQRTQTLSTSEINTAQWRRNRAAHREAPLKILKAESASNHKYTLNTDQPKQCSELQKTNRMENKTEGRKP